MKLHTKLALGLISSLFVANLATAAEPGTKMSRHNLGMDCNNMSYMPGDMSYMPGDMRTDPIARAQKNLSELKAKLNLTNDQQPAWQTFSDQVNDQAKNMTEMRNKMKDKMQTMPKTAPEQMANMAEMMKDRAQGIAKMADAVKTFYATLTPEQQIAFDKVHMSRMGRTGRMK